MQFPAGLPTKVQEGVKLYLRTRRSVGMRTFVAVGSAVLGLLLVCFLLLDRFAELSVPVRSFGPWIVTVGLCLVAAGGLGLGSGLWRWGPRDALEVAVHLDKALPEHQDRWGTAVDLARRTAAGEDVGPAALLSRLHEETEAQTSLGRVAGTVGRGPLRAASACFLMMLLLFGALQVSAAFDLHLLWQRFWRPGGNLPRDSFTVIRFLEANGRPWSGAHPGALSEGSTFSLTLALARRQSWLAGLGEESAGFQAPPRVEIATGSGMEVHECLRRGEEWQFRLPRLSAPLRFRVRAGDALSAWWQQPVTPRIKLNRLIHTLRYPKYAHLESVVREELTAKRLSALEGTRMEFEVFCSEPYEVIEATFEVLQKEGDVLSQDELLRVGGPDGQERQEDTGRRALTVRRRGEEGGRFRLVAEESGILRVRAQGKNGLFSRERLCLIEALADGPPTITIRGLEGDTTIIPGETVAYQYEVEDDYAVSDLILSWTVAGGANVADLSGEEYLHHPDYGKQRIGGQELIQRMNYKVYSTSPFEFQLIAVDSRGQEAHTPTYRIHIIDDDFAARFERGMKYLELAHEAAKGYGDYHQNLANQLNIITAAVGDKKTWPAAQAALLAGYTKTMLQPPNAFGYVGYYLQRYGGFPYRLNRAAVLLALPHRVLPGYGDLTALVDKLPGSRDVPALLAELRQAHEKGQVFASVWLAAANAERERFLPEYLLQRARKLMARLQSLAGLEHNPSLYTANLQFYLEEVLAVMVAAAELRAPAPALQQVLVHLRQAHGTGNVPALLQHLPMLLVELAARATGPSPQSVRLVEALTQSAGEDEAARQRLMGAWGEVMRARGQEDLFRPAELLAFGQATQAGEAATGNWYVQPVTQMDLWLALDQAHQDLQAHQLDLLCGRHDLFAAAAADREAALRERLLVISRMASAATGLAQATRASLATALAEGAREDLGALLRQPDPTLMRAIEQALRESGGQEALRGWRATLPQHAVLLRDGLRALAAAFDAHSPQCEALAAQPESLDTVVGKGARGRLHREALALKQRVEGLEAYTRAVLFLLTQARVQDAERTVEWAGWRPLHGLQLAMTLAASQAQEKVSDPHGRVAYEPPVEQTKQYPLIAASSREMAAELRRCADLAPDVLAGKSTDYDFAALMKRHRVQGHLEHAQEEYEYVQAFFGAPAVPVAAEMQERLRNSALGGIVRQEGYLVRLVHLQRELDRALAADASAVRTVLETLLRTVQDDEEAETLRSIVQMLARQLAGASAGADALRQPALGRQISTLRQALSETQSRLAAAVRLPPVKATAQLNRRYITSKGPINLWTIQGIVDGFDRRWVEGLRYAELCLVRELAGRCLAEAVVPRHSQSLALQYGRIVELRARNLANERRRNRGLSFLAEDEGPSLRLPKHIAAEFFKARNRRSPAAFKEHIEAYYEALYKDLSQ